MRMGSALSNTGCKHICISQRQGSLLSLLQNGAPWIDGCWGWKTLALT